MDLVVRPVIMRDALDSLLIGCVLPFGHKTHLRVFIDPDLLQYEPIREHLCGRRLGPRRVPDHPERSRACKRDGGH